MEKYEQHFFASHAEVVRSCLNALGCDEKLLEALEEFGGEVYANRLVGALIAVGRTEVAQYVMASQERLGRKVVADNPFIRQYEPIRLPERSPVASRLRLLWQAMRERIRLTLPEMNPRTDRSIAEVLSEMDDGYVADSYHSLSIEGYRVSEDLIRRVRDGLWNPGENLKDEESRNAMAASGYYRAYRKVRRAVERMLRGESVGEVIAAEVGDWHREAGDFAIRRRCDIILSLT